MGALSSWLQAAQREDDRRRAAGEPTWIELAEREREILRAMRRQCSDWDDANLYGGPNC